MSYSGLFWTEPIINIYLLSSITLDYSSYPSIWNNVDTIWQLHVEIRCNLNSSWRKPPVSCLWIRYIQLQIWSRFTQIKCILTLYTITSVCQNVLHTSVKMLTSIICFTIIYSEASICVKWLCLFSRILFQTTGSSLVWSVTQCTKGNGS